MRVSNTISFPENQEVTNNKVAAGGSLKAKSRLESGSLAPDEANLSVDPQKVQELKTNLANLPDVRLDKVQELQKAVSAGTYQVDAGKVADAMITNLAAPRQGSK